MNIVRVLPLVLCIVIPGVTFAKSGLDGLEFGANKQQLVRDTKEKCQPKQKISDDAWANKILASEDNQYAIRNAKVALEKNNQKDYKNAISKITCPPL